MNKTSIFISLLLIVAFVNTKRVSYSDIVSSFMQIKDDDAAASVLQLVDSSASNFKESFNLFTAYDAQLTAQCQGIQARSAQRSTDFANSIAGLNTSVQEMTNANVALGDSIAADRQSIVDNEAKIGEYNQQSQDARDNLQQKTLKYVERRRVLQRLSNLVQDELTGGQRTGTVGTINVDKSLSGYSFLEVHNQLKGLKDKDPMIKSMITTLIMITQDQNNLFANQETVSRVQNVINQLLTYYENKATSLNTSTNETLETLKQSVAALNDANSQLGENIASNNAQVESNVSQIARLNAEVVSMQTYSANAERRSQNNLSLCTQLSQMVQSHSQVWSEFSSRFEEVRSQLE